MRKRGLYCHPASVCLSRWCIVSTRLKILSNLFLSLVAPSFEFFDPEHWYPIPRGIPSAGTQNTQPWENFATLTEIAVYLGNSTRYTHGSRGTLIGSHRWQIDSCQLMILSDP